MSMLAWLTLPFYDFCDFRSVAVNSVYKPQFFTFIFAVLLPGLSRLLIMSLVLHFRFFKIAAIRHLRFFNCSKYLLLVWRAIHYYVRTYAKNSVTRKFCDFLYVLNCYQFVKIVLRTCSPATMSVFYLQNAYFNGRLGVLVK